MKKIAILILIIFAGNICRSNNLNGFSDAFRKKFQNCEPYSEEISFNANGTVYHDKKQIDGWFGDYCGYKQTIKTAQMTLYVGCGFSKTQVDALYNALLLEPDNSGSSKKTFEIWDRYVLDNNNCTLNGKNIFGDGIKVDPKYLPYF